MSEISYSEIKPGVHHIHRPLDEDVAFTSYKLAYTTGGTWYDPEDRWGEGHLTEHNHLCTVDERTQQEYRRDLDEKLININGTTGPLTMDLWIEGHRKFTERLWSDFLVLALNPVLREDLFQQEKAVVLGEIVQSHGDPQYLLRQFINQALFEPNSYGIRAGRATLGTYETIEPLQLDDIRDRHERNLRNSHLLFTTLGGNMDLDEVRGEIESATANINPTPIDPIDFWPPSGFKQFDVLPLVHPLGPDGVGVSVFLPVTMTLENAPQRSLVFDTLRAMIFQRLRLDLGLIYSFGANFYGNDHLVEFNAVCSMKHVQAVVGELKALISGKSARFDEERFEKAKEKNSIYMDLNYSDKDEFNEASGMLMTYGRITSFRETSQRLQDTTLEQVNDLVDEMANNLDKVRVMGLSNNTDVIPALTGRAYQERSGRRIFNGFNFGAFVKNSRVGKNKPRNK